MKTEREAAGNPLGLYSAIGISAGTTVAAAVGAVLDSIPIGIAAGVGMGVAMGSLAGYLNSGRKEPQPQERDPGRPDH